MGEDDWMQAVLTPVQMRELEERYMREYGVPSLDLMERAAQEVSASCLELAGDKGRTAAFVCGRGGNGGDGFAAARLYAQIGGRSIVIPLYGTDSLSPDARVNCERARGEAGVAFVDPDALDRLETPAVWVDAVFGIGYGRELDRLCARVFRRMEVDRAAGSPVLSVDIPSGLNGLTGRADSHAVRADRTLTFECPKPGHFLGDGLDLTGELVTAPLGIPGELLPPDALLHYTPAQALAELPLRPRNSHKGQYGHLLIVAGSRGMAGAAQLCAMAALASGAGLVTLAVPTSLLPILQIGVPCAMAVPLPEAGGVLSQEAVPLLEKAMEGKNAVAIGPGLGRADQEVVGCVLRSGLPTVLDADALNLMARHGELRDLLSRRHLITPHPGEAARLLGAPVTSPLEALERLLGFGAAAVLKGASCLMGGEGTYIRTCGSSGMAKGGSGDVLTGMIGALLAQGLSTGKAARIGAAIHGRAGEIAARRMGEMAMTPLDMIASLGEAWTVD